MQDWRFARHPLVEGPPYIRFYAAFPLITADGYVVGAFAVFDPEPRYSFELDMRSDLEDLARKAVQHLVAVSHDLQSMHETELFVADEVRSLQTSRPASSVSGSARVWMPPSLPSERPRPRSPDALNHESRPRAIGATRQHHSTREAQAEAGLRHPIRSAPSRRFLHLR